VGEMVGRRLESVASAFDKKPRIRPR